jgi:hypothetical protein
MLFDRIKKILAALLIVVILTGSVAPHTAKAQWATFDAANAVQNTISAIAEVGSQVMEYYNKYKESVLDGLAWALAKSILQSMTADIVQWINNGFEGNPAFVSYPEGFFMDAADQAAGAFINAGPLSALCSPFSLDIRLNLSLTIAQKQRARYACTLSTIINNTRNSRVNVQGNVNVNGQTVSQSNASLGPTSVQGSVTQGGTTVGGGASIDGFMGGDFRQGGWAAYVAMTTEPQNNVYGARIIADSELRSQIGQKQATINADLNMGAGFLSMEKCEKVMSYNESDPEAVATGESMAAGTPDVRIKTDKDGNTTIESCHKETPGSVISGSLNKSLGLPGDSLNMADEINEIISALFSQLVMQVLNQGLYTAGGGGGRANSVAAQLSNDSNRNVDKYKKRLLNDMTDTASSTVGVLPILAEAYALVDTERSAYIALMTCLAPNATSSRPGILEGYEELSSVYREEIDPIYREYKQNYEDVVTDLDRLDVLIAQVDIADTMSKLYIPAGEYTEMIGANNFLGRTATPIANQNLRAVKNELKIRPGKPTWRSVYADNRPFCSGLPATTASTTTTTTP